MSKHINFVCDDTLYSSILFIMKIRNIKNISSAIRYLLMLSTDNFYVLEKIPFPSDEKNYIKSIDNIEKV